MRGGVLERKGDAVAFFALSCIRYVGVLHVCKILRVVLLLVLAVLPRQD